MEEISRNRGQSRVFMVGIGSAPNTFLMRRMAEAGRGTFTHVGYGDEAESQMQRLLDRLARPVATDLTATVNGGNIDFAPRDLPDLYAGEPLVLLGRTRHLQGTLTVSGLIEGRRWSQTIDLSQGSQSDVVAKLWAYRRIAEVEAERWSGETSYERADESIEELGMAFHLVTSRTSLIAVDDTPSRPEGAMLTREELPLLLPAGWDFDHLFGVQFANRDRDLPMREMEKQRQQLELPETSTGYVLTLGLGLLLLLAGLAMALGHRWERLRSALPLRSLHSQVA
jgi:Ca-activated chloride channel family protein